MPEGRRVGFWSAAACALALIACGQASAAASEARIVSEERLGPREIVLTVETPAFAKPTKVTVDLPARYRERPRKRWPVTYFLAGTMNSHRTFNTLVDGLALTERFPAIIVSPHGDSGYWSDWYNGGAFGPPMYETYVAEQLIPLIDERFRTRPWRSQRAVIGVSMGGYGALMMAARHPDLFAAASSISGAVDSNLAVNGLVLSLSPTFQGGEIDAIYGPRLTEEVRWRGHNPVDLAENLRGLALQVRTANGTLNTALGEHLLSADSVSCAVEWGVYRASLSLHGRLQDLDVPHLWQDYGRGCHSVPNFTRELADTLAALKPVFRDPPKTPRRFDYLSIETEFEVWGWRVRADRRRPLEFLELRGAGRHGVRVIGSGRAKVVTPPYFRRTQRVRLRGARERFAVPNSRGRIRFTVDLGPPSAGQQFRPGSQTNRVSRVVRFSPR
ncbi:MAG TPA: alpha/beta hydrolase family protein [Solirubrobacterales bacterium]|jgi:S-formylglutathione hydrolase FrmB